MGRYIDTGLYTQVTVAIHMHKDQIRTLRILQRISEFARLQKHQSITKSISFPNVRLVTVGLWKKKKNK